MADNRMELKLRLVNELISLWQELERQLEEGIESPVVDNELEDKCMATKTKIAQRKQLAKELIGDDFSCNGAMVKVLLGIPTLDLFKKQSPIIISNLKNVWHDALIALNQLAGNLKIQINEGGGSDKQAKKKSGSFLGRLMGRG